MIIWETARTVTPKEITELQGKIKAIIYARVSTSDQAEHGYSLTSQVERCVEKANRDFHYSDDELLAIMEPGFSGDDPNRPSLNLALNLLEQGIGTKLLALHPDRLARDSFQQNSILQRIMSTGCLLDFVEIRFDHNDPTSVLMFQIFTAVAQYGKAQILMNSKRGRRAKATAGKIPGIRRLYGYTFDKETDSLVENPDERKTYDLMVDWLLNGRDGKEMNGSQIAEELARMGIPAPEGENWYQSSVTRILRNEVYKGTFYYGKTEVKQSQGKKSIVGKPRESWTQIPIPQYIDEETFSSVQKRLDLLQKRHNGRPSEQYLVRGYTRCGRCGRAVVSGSPAIGAGGKTIRYYSCSGRSKKRFKVGSGEANEVCRGSNWRQDVVDQYVWDYVSGLLQHPDELIHRIIRQQSDLGQIELVEQKKADLEKAIADKQAQKRRAVNLHISGRITLTDFEDIVEPLDEDIESLKAELEVTTRGYDKAQLTKEGLDLLMRAVEEFRLVISLPEAELKYDLKRSIIDRFIEKVVLYDDTIEIMTTWDVSAETSSETAATRGNSQKRQGDGRSQR